MSSRPLSARGAPRIAATITARIAQGALAASSLFLAACAAAGDSAPKCETGFDCASGICNVDGTCAPPSTTASTGAHETSSSSTAGAAASTSSGAGGAGEGGGAGGSTTCSPNDDGTITAAEVPLQAGLMATFRAAENVTVDTAGAAGPSGGRVWDYTAMLSGDHDELVETISPSGQWWASDFAGATYAAKLSDTQPLLGVFKVTSAALELLGVVSPSSTPPATELKYDPAVTVLAFPLTQGATWQSNSSVTGYADSTPVVYTEDYQSSVDAHGTVKTPFGPFPVLRVRTNLTRTVGATVTLSHQFSFVTECFGTVATVNSQADETQAEFTNASEITRLAP